MGEKSFLNLTCIIQSVETPQVNISDICKCTILYCLLYCAGRVLASREPAAVQLGPGDGVPAEQEDQHHLRHQPLGLAHLHPAVG